MFKATEGDWLQFCLCNDAMEVFCQIGFSNLGEKPLAALGFIQQCYVFFETFENYSTKWYNYINMILLCSEF